MTKQRALVISDDPVRNEYLFNELKNKGFYPVSYLNIFAYRKAVESDDFKIIVADLSMPIEPKLDIIKRGAKRHPRPRLITIGKYEYLKTLKNPLDPNVETLKTLKEFSVIMND